MPYSRDRSDRAPCRLALLVVVILAAAGFLTSAARAQDRGLNEQAWALAPGARGTAQWGPGSVTLGVAEGAAGAVRVQARSPLTGDFIAEVSYELLDWKSGVGQAIAMGFGIATTAQAPADKQQSVEIGREWAGALDQYRSSTLKGAQTYLRAGAINVDPRGRLRILRRGGLVQAAFQVGPGWDTLQLFTMYRGEPIQPFLYASNSGPEARAFPAVRVRFFDLKVQNLPPLKGAGGTVIDPGGDGGWVIYSTGPGWLRIGSAREVAAEQKTRDEIFGGNSEAPLVKTPLQGGFSSRAEALAYLCDHLTKVHVRYFPTSRPHEVIRGMFEGNEYYLRLVGGDDPEALTKAENYDLAAEKSALKERGITPRMGFGKQWLIHITGHGTVDGNVRDDAWVTFNREPQKDPSRGGGSFVRPDGFGGTIGYSCDRWEGPYRDNFGLARALKRLNVAEVALYPGGSYTQKVVAAEVPENPRDHGAEVLGVQPIVDPEELSDWVVYVTGGVWLHVGTRAEFEHPVKSRETLWAGPGEEVMQRESIPLGAGFSSYEEALQELAGKLTDVRAAFHPTAEPRETLAAAVNGRQVHLHLSRDPDAIIASYGTYSYAAEAALLRRFGKTPVKRFQKQWLVHANSVGTVNGPQKRDFWMMVSAQPKNNSVELPDGMGGTFGYGLDAVEGPFTESGALAVALKSRGLKSIRLYGEDREVTVDEAGPPPAPATPEKPEILSITPDRGEPGTTFYITVIATGMKPGYRFRFGPGVTVTSETSLGKNPDGPGERWLATIAIDKDSSFRAGQ